MRTGRRRFRIIREIAEGGFGKVYLAEQLTPDGFSKVVALKLLHQKWSTHDEVAKRTRDEARLLGLIRHQNIVRVEDLTSLDGKLTIVMEYLDGMDLKEIRQFLAATGSRFPRRALLEVGMASASALDAAYNSRPLQGGDPLRVIHRDIKPSNVFITIAGDVRVLDFGTARADFDAREAKTLALAFGSKGYMSPERVLGEDDTHEADVFSLGVTMAEMLSLEAFGRIPARPRKYQEFIDSKLENIPTFGPANMGDAFRDFLRKMMAYDPTERPSAAEVLTEFENFTFVAPGMSLRQFCRDILEPAKRSMPERQSDDPLTGCVIEEDPSSAWARKIPKEDTPIHHGSRLAAPPPGSATSRRKSATPAPHVRRGTTQPIVDDDSEPTDIQGAASAGNRSPMRMILILLGGLTMVAALAVFAAIVIILVIFGPQMMEEFSQAMPDGPPDPVLVDAADEDVEAPVLEPMLEITRTDVRKDKAPQPSGLVLSSEAPPTTTIKFVGKKGRSTATWTGGGTLEDAELVADEYRVKVTGPMIDGVMRSSIVVEPKKTCRFTLSGPGEAWSGGCE